jgi:hypothetical protein
MLGYFLNTCMILLLRDCSTVIGVIMCVGGLKMPRRLMDVEGSAQGCLICAPIL